MVSPRGISEVGTLFFKLAPGLSVVAKKRACLDSQRAPDSGQLQQRQIPNPALNSGHVRAVDSRCVRKYLLRQAQLTSRSPNAESHPP